MKLNDYIRHTHTHLRDISMPFHARGHMLREEKGGQGKQLLDALKPHTIHTMVTSTSFYLPITIYITYKNI